ncbi:MAG: hypothetical protein HIU88_09120 [Acidobacteria bacterium]|nr:hypothetical protein [Acidobacteriota bacterium]
MTDGWSESSRESPRSRESDDYERELALIDRILGLEAQLAEQSVDFALTPSEQLRVEQQIARMRGSLTWRFGQIAATPLNIVSHRMGRRKRDG